MVKKIYQTPEIHTHILAMHDVVLQPTSIQIDDNNKVDNEGDIGFTKEERQGKNVWDDDWSKQEN